MEVRVLSWAPNIKSRCAISGFFIARSRPHSKGPITTLPKQKKHKAALEANASQLSPDRQPLRPLETKKERISRSFLQGWL
ncbi:hypothetical protein, partial [Paracidovorax anthurii]|uniref:hypothetical protein n=1 Tax=Paracidovorax anthurii TaxID=78229 RepID=UPI001B85DB26